MFPPVAHPHPFRKVGGAARRRAGWPLVLIAQAILMMSASEATDHRGQPPRSTAYVNGQQCMLTFVRR
jgi:hypothetical protein